MGTDFYPGENKWTILSSDGTSIQSETFEAAETYNSQFCLDANLCHEFIIEDTAGDGLLNLNGFSVLVNNVEVLTDFPWNPTSTFSSLSTKIGQQCSQAEADCVDSRYPFLYTRKRTCEWVGMVPGRTQRLCQQHVVRSMCPKLCDACDDFRCKDGAIKFFFSALNGQEVKKGCKWVGNKIQQGRQCAIDGVREICRETCGTCA